jgi:DNA polymerase-3 subunit delta'
VPPAILATLLAQDTAKATLMRALERARVHHAYLFDGPEGVGKELAALGLAQALVCERRPESGVGADRACGECSACTRVAIRPGSARPLHPDVVILERGLYSPEQIGRRTPETQDLSIDQIRTLVLARAAFPPHEGRARVFIVRRAEELSTGGANALLKTLEEPGDRTHFILLSARADSLLPTIRSRTQRVRFGRLPDAIVLQLLTLGGTPAAQAAAVSRLAHGSMEEAAMLADPEATAEREAFVTKALVALETKGLGRILEVAEDAKKQKDALDLHLLALAHRLAEDACRDVRAGSSGVSAANRYQLVLGALGQLRGNAAAQLVAESLLIRMRGA